MKSRKGKSLKNVAQLGLKWFAPHIPFMLHALALLLSIPKTSSIFKEILKVHPCSFPNHQFTQKPSTNSHHLLPTNHINPQSLQGKTPTESNKKRKQQQLPPMAINLFCCPSRPFRVGGTCGLQWCWVALKIKGKENLLKDPLCPHGWEFPYLTTYYGQTYSIDPKFTNSSFLPGWAGFDPYKRLKALSACLSGKKSLKHALCISCLEKKRLGLVANVAGCLLAEAGNSSFAIVLVAHRPHLKQ